MENCQVRSLLAPTCRWIVKSPTPGIAGSVRRAVSRNSASAAEPAGCTRRKTTVCWMLLTPATFSRRRAEHVPQRREGGRGDELAEPVQQRGPPAVLLDQAEGLERCGAERRVAAEEAGAGDEQRRARHQLPGRESGEQPEQDGAGQVDHRGAHRVAPRPACGQGPVEDEPGHRAEAAGQGEEQNGHAGRRRATAIPRADAATPTTSVPTAYASAWPTSPARSSASVSLASAL